MHMRRNHISLFFLVLSLLIHYADSARGADVKAILRKVSEELKRLNNNDAKSVNALKETELLLNVSKDGELYARKQNTHFYIPRGLEGLYPAESIPSLIKKRAFVDTSVFDLTMLREDANDGTGGGALLFVPWANLARPIAKNPIDVKEWQEWYNKIAVYNTPWATDRYASFKMAERAQKFPFDRWTTDHYLSYDEMQIAALMIVAGPAKFHSNCQLEYVKRLYKDGEYVKDGYIVGAVGPRLEIPGIMDWAIMVPTHYMTANGEPKQDLHEAIRGEIYGEQLKTLPDPIKAGKENVADYFWWEWTFDNPKQGEKKMSFLEPAAKKWIAETHAAQYDGKKIPRVPVHKEILLERLKITYGAYFDFVVRTMKEENAERQKKAYASVAILSLGGGVWSINGTHHGKQVWAAIRGLVEDKSRDYKRFIKTLHFVGHPTFVNAENDIALNNIEIKRNMGGSTGNMNSDEDTVLFVVYPWDSNALPGNEWWMPASSSWPGKLEDGTQVPTLTTVWEASGDPAAACCSDIIYTENWVNNRHLADEGDAIYLSQDPANVHVGDYVCGLAPRMIGARQGYLADDIIYVVNDIPFRLVVGPHFNPGKSVCTGGFSLCSIVRARGMKPCNCAYEASRCDDFKLASENRAWLYGAESWARKWADNELQSKDPALYRQIQAKWAELLKPSAGQSSRRLQTDDTSRDLLTSGLSSYSFYSVVLVTVILATAMFVVSFFWVVV